MIVPPFRLALTVAGTVVALVLTGCAANLSPTAAPASTTAAAPSAAPLPIDQRVVEGNLSGLTASGTTKTANSPTELTRLVGGEMAGASVDDQGFVKGAVKKYETGSAQGLSITLQGTDEQTARRFMSEFEAAFANNPTLSGGTTGSLPAVPGSKTYTLEKDGNVLAWVAFVDGPFAYFVLAGGPTATVKAQEVFDAGSTLYQRVKGAPAA